MNINSLEIKNKTNYDSDTISHINDFDVNSLVLSKKESRIGVNIYYTRCDLNLDNNNNIIPLCFFIDRLIGFIEEIDGSSDKYLVNPGIKIKDYNKFRFNSDIDLPVNTIIEFRSLLINVCCVIEKDNEYHPEINLDECS